MKRREQRRSFWPPSEASRNTASKTEGEHLRKEKEGWSSDAKLHITHLHPHSADHSCSMQPFRSSTTTCACVEVCIRMLRGSRNVTESEGPGASHHKMARTKK